MPNAIVLGAGMAGVSAALQLQKRGWSVAIVDRKAPGLETSFGNAGIIQGEAVKPYPMPRDVATLFAIALGTSNTVRYDLRSLPGQASVLFQYWWNSAPRRHQAISVAYAKIISAATAEHRTLIAETSTENLVKREGFRALHRTKAAMDLAVEAAGRLRADYGVAYKALSPAELAQAEPALIETGAGAIQWLDAWTVSDPGGLVSEYAGLFQRLGGTLALGDAASLRQTPGSCWSVRTDDGDLEAEHVVVALGPWSPPLLRGFGYRFPMVRKRGYHMHYRPKRTLNLPLRDDAFSYAMAPMTTGLRITTGADLSSGHGHALPPQLRRAEQAARQLLDLGAPIENQPWEGTRPCMPDMLPVVGAAKNHKGLWAHFGHGHQGFTLGPVTGRMLAELMSGETPFIDPSPLRPDRY